MNVTPRRRAPPGSQRPVRLTAPAAGSGQDRRDQRRDVRQLMRRACTTVFGLVKIDLVLRVHGNVVRPRPVGGRQASRLACGPPTPGRSVRGCNAAPSHAARSSPRRSRQIAAFLVDAVAPFDLPVLLRPSRTDITVPDPRRLHSEHELRGNSRPLSHCSLRIRKGKARRSSLRNAKLEPWGRRRYKRSTR